MVVVVMELNRGAVVFGRLARLVVMALDLGDALEELLFRLDGVWLDRGVVVAKLVVQILMLELEHVALLDGELCDSSAEIWMEDVLRVLLDALDVLKKTLEVVLDASKSLASHTPL